MLLKYPFLICLHLCQTVAYAWFSQGFYNWMLAMMPLRPWKSRLSKAKRAKNKTKNPDPKGGGGCLNTPNTNFSLKGGCLNTPNTPLGTHMMHMMSKPLFITNTPFKPTLPVGTRWTPDESTGRILLVKHRWIFPPPFQTKRRWTPMKIIQPRMTSSASQQLNRKCTLRQREVPKTSSAFSLVFTGKPFRPDFFPANHRWTPMNSRLTSRGRGG